jgi:hypothetical protein
MSVDDVAAFIACMKMQPQRLQQASDGVVPQARQLDQRELPGYRPARDPIWSPLGRTP